MIYSTENVESNRQDLGCLWPLLKPGLWHSTTSERFCAILSGGEIRPDNSEGGSDYRGSLALSINAVSLFDFENASEIHALGNHGKWITHLRRHDTAVTVWIGLNRGRLPGRLILTDEGGERATANKLNYYPRVEACHVGPIPTCAFADVLAVSTANPYQFETLGSGETGLRRLSELVEQWASPEPSEVGILRAGRE